MILVDTSIWIDHLRHRDPGLTDPLNDGQVLCHPLVIGEVALGHVRERRRLIESLQELPQAIAAAHDEGLRRIERHA